MTRKKFIKLLMAKGYSRNGAQVIAWEQVEKGRSYEDAYRSYSSVSRLADVIGPELVAALNSATDAIMSLVRAICAGMGAFSEAFSKSMSMGGEHERITTDDQAAPGVLCLPQNGDREPAGEAGPDEERGEDPVHPAW